jgi:hypothetical protein
MMMSCLAPLRSLICGKKATPIFWLRSIRHPCVFIACEKCIIYDSVCACVFFCPGSIFDVWIWMNNFKWYANAHPPLLANPLVRPHLS